MLSGVDQIQRFFEICSKTVGFISSESVLIDVEKDQPQFLPFE
jgi:hypothetical protein